MDEIDERLRLELVQRVAEGALEGRIEALEVAVETGHAEQLEREREELVDLLLARAPSADVAAQRACLGGSGSRALVAHGRSTSSAADAGTEVSTMRGLAPGVWGRATIRTYRHDVRKP